MTGGEMAYLGLVIGGMTLFAVVVAWAAWRTPNRRDIVDARRQPAE